MKTQLSLLIFCMWTIASYAQLSTSQVEQIDEIFVDWNQPNFPGGSVAIEIDGKVVYNQAFGLASLEYLVPNNVSTRFNIASVSKQFTSMGILLMEKQGKLSVKDDIRKHLPELPDFGHTITFEHLMHHTSGLRSLHAMLEMAGWRGDDARDNDDLMRYMQRQQELNFNPGDDYLYCNTGYILMAVVIERLSGESFRDWMQTHIFTPLNMPNTFVEDQYNRVVSGGATSYYGSSPNAFSRAVEYWGYVGSGNIHSTTADLLNWQKNYFAPTKGWEDLFEKMETGGILNDGSPTHYAYGIGINEVQGKKNISHGGAIGGFRSFASTFPTEKTNVVILTNFSAANVGGKAREIAAILFPEASATEAEEAPEPAMDAVKLTSKQMARFEGWYWTEEFMLARHVYLQNDTLFFARPSGFRTTFLVPLSENSFHLAEREDIVLTFEGKGKNKVMQIQEGRFNARYESFVPPLIDAAYLAQYAGNYYSEELDTYYQLYEREGELYGYHARHGEFAISVVKDDALRSENWAVQFMLVQRDDKGKVEGLLITNGRVRNARFKRLE
ncbi:MAG: serine hydrolase domain-containing protein [Bacteroidota bacterium]